MGRQVCWRPDWVGCPEGSLRVTRLRCHADWRSTTGDLVHGVLLLPVDRDHLEEVGDRLAVRAHRLVELVVAVDPADVAAAVGPDDGRVRTREVHLDDVAGLRVPDAAHVLDLAAAAPVPAGIARAGRRDRDDAVGGLAHDFAGPLLAVQADVLAVVGAGPRQDGVVPRPLAEAAPPLLPRQLVFVLADLRVVLRIVLRVAGIRDAELLSGRCDAADAHHADAGGQSRDQTQLQKHLHKVPAFQ